MLLAAVCKNEVKIYAYLSSEQGQKVCSFMFSITFQYRRVRN